MMQTFELIAPCHFGLESVVKNEIYDLGYEITEVDDGRVTFEGDAEAILKVQTATAEGIKKINESAPSEAVLRIKALEAFAAAANGQATKIIIPSEIQGIAGLAESVKDIVKE